MIHNKYYNILKQFTGEYIREIYGRQLIGKVKLSQKAIALTLEELEKESILKARKQGNIKLYYLNIESIEIKDMLIIVEYLKKKEFLAKHRTLAHLFKEDKRIIGIFGSYAKDTQKEDSDIDVFIIGKKIPEDYEKKGKKFDLDVSIKYFSEKEWQQLVKNKNNLWKEIISHHVLIFGMEKFVNVVWKEYYGLN